MSPATPFVDPETETVDTDQIFVEAIPLAKLIGLFVAIAVVPLTAVVLIGSGSPFGLILAVVAQFVLAIGAGIVLLYIIARGIQLADE